MSKPQTVFIVGATGKTGGSIHVIAAIRPASASKPEVSGLKDRGADIRVIDLETSSVDQIAEHLKNVDFVISAFVWSQLDLQKPLIHASKKAGVKRFVPDDWATPCVRGVREYYDQKAVFHDLIKEVGLGYTFIDIGWWIQNIQPIVDPAKEPVPGFNFGEFVTRTIYGSGDVKLALTDVRDIGKFVANIITDERTLNKYVLAYGDELTQKEVIAISERILGKKIQTNSNSADFLAKLAKESEGFQQNLAQYMHSIFVRGDNNIESARKEEYGSALDVKELYPDLKVTSFEDYAKEYYSV